MLSASHIVFAGGFAESETNKVKFPEISAAILERVCQYFYYKLRYQNTCAGCMLVCWPASQLHADCFRCCRPTKQIPEFPLPPDQALVLLKAANYLDT